MKSSLRTFAAAATLATGSLAPLSAQYVTPAPGKIRVWIEAIPMTVGAQGVYVRNTGAEPLTFDEIKLTGCANVVQACEVYPYGQQVKAGETRMFLRLEPLNKNQGMRYAVSYHFTPTLHQTRDVTADSMPSGPPPSHEPPALQRIVVNSGGVVDNVKDARLRVALGKDAGTCTMAMNAPSVAGHRYVMMVFPRGQIMARTISLEIDGDNVLTQYTENRAELPPKKSAPGTTNTTTVLMVMPTQNTAVILNMGGDSANESFTVRSPGLMNAPELGFPGSNAAQVWKACDKVHKGNTPLVWATAAPDQQPPPRMQVITPARPDDGSATVRRPVPEGNVSTTAATAAAPITLETIYDPAKFVARVGVPATSGVCTSEPSVQSPARWRKVGMAWLVNNVLARRVAIDIDTLGQVATYLDNRYGAMPTGAPDGTAKPQTIVKIMNGPKQASLMNVGGLEKQEGFALFMDNVMTEKALGVPRDVAAEVVRKCGGVK